jgi:NIMA (never in mitosis gene a)-related kinase
VGIGQIFEMESSARQECVVEAKLLQSIPPHPHIIQYLESFLQGNELYLVLELAEGGDVAQLVERCKAHGRRLHELEIWYESSALYR